MSTMMFIGFHFDLQATLLVTNNDMEQAIGNSTESYILIPRQWLWDESAMSKTVEQLLLESMTSSPPSSTDAAADPASTTPPSTSSVAAVSRLIRDSTLRKSINDLTFPERRQLIRAVGLPLPPSDAELSYRVSSLIGRTAFNHNTRTNVVVDVMMLSALALDVLLLRRRVLSQTSFGFLTLISMLVALPLAEHAMSRRTMERLVASMERGDRRRFLDAGIRASEIDLAQNQQQKQSGSWWETMFITSAGNNLSELTLKTKWIEYLERLRKQSK
jgi:hypothetical protein